MNQSRRIIWIQALAAITCASLARAQENPVSAEQPERLPDKSGYTLFNPTPRAFMRDMVTDRPDRTESPYTVDAGHFQLEMDLVSYTRDEDNQGGGVERFSGWSFATMNLKLGLRNDTDFQLILPAWNRTRNEESAGGHVTHRSGFGDVVTRLKYNFWGNDGGRTALAIMPFAKYPTAQDGMGNGAFEGGVILPLAIDLPAKFGLGLMSEVDVNKNTTDSGYHAEVIHTATIGREIYGPLEAYTEIFTLVNTEKNAGLVITYDFGLVYAISKDLRLDAGVNIGLTRAADDWNPFVGLSWRY